MDVGRAILERLKPWKVALRALRHRNYQLFFAGQGVSLIGTWMQSTALPWLVFQKSGSKLLLGVVAFAGTVPASILTPLAGVISDRVDRRRILIATQTLAMLQAFILSGLVVADVIEVWHIIALGVFLGVIVAFDMPARQAFVVEMIDDRRDLGNAIALNSLMFNGARFVGPALAGVVVGLFGEGPVFAANGLSFLAVIASYFAMKTRPRAHRHAGTHVLSELVEGMRYVFRQPGIRSILLLLSLTSLVGMSYVTLMPAFARDILGGEAQTYGWLLTSIGLGAIVGAIHLATRRDLKGFARKIVLAAAGMSLGLVAFSQSRVFWLSAGLLLVIGFSSMVQMASSNTVVQTLVSDDKRGRMMGLYALCFMGVAPLGNLLTGAVAQRIGAPTTVLLSGLCCLLTVSILAAKLVRVDRMAHPIPAANGVPEEIAEGMRAATGTPPEPLDEPNSPAKPKS